MANHKLNARIHKLPFCPECFAARTKACTNPNGTTRAPHRVRELVVDGLIVVKRSRRWKKLIALRDQGRLIGRIDERGY